MENLAKQLKAYIYLSLILLFIFSTGYFVASKKASSVYKALSLDKSTIEGELQKAKNKTSSLNKLLSESSKETEELKQLIQVLEDRPAEVRYIVRTETIIEGGTETTATLPASYLYRFDSGLAVAHFLSEATSYTFEIFDLKFKSQVLISEDTTGVLLSATSSFEPSIEVPIPLNDITVTKVREHNLFEPHVLISGTLSLPTLDASVSLSTSLIHPTAYLDILSLRGSVSRDNIRIGIDPVSYNIGHKLPIITDLWITGGASIGTGSTVYSGDLSMGSKF